jgi:GNAT superfamily N-acetyltransferase
VIEIETLFDRREFIPLVAQWTWTEWSDLLPSDSCEAFANNLRAATRRDGIPITFVALENGVPIGTAGLIDDDLESRPELTPWLASLYVVREMRGRGVATMLVKHAVGAARGFGIGTLYLYIRRDRRRFTSVSAGTVWKRRSFADGRSRS